MTEETPKQFKFSSVIKPNVPGANGRIYTEEVLKKAMEKYQERVDSRSALGQLGQTTGPLRIRDASHLVTDMDIEDGELKVTCEVLDTPEGYRLLEMLKQGKVSISPSFHGWTKDIYWKGKRIAEEVEDIQIRSFDIVPGDE